MKQLNYYLLCAMAILVSLLYSCKPEGGEVKGKGNVILSLKQEAFSRDGKQTEEVMSIDSYTMTIDGESVAIPADGVLTEMEAGKHTIALTDYNGEFTPDFNAGRHSAEVDVDVHADADNAAEVILAHINAGVYFEYDASLANLGLEDVYPVISNGTETLSYAGNKNGIGYFMPGSLNVTLFVGETPVDIQGLNEKTIVVEAGQLWKINLKVQENPSKAASGALEIEPILIVDPTNEEDWGIGENMTSVTNFNVQGLAGETVTVFFKNNESQKITFDNKGVADITIKGLDVITRLETATDMIFIGRQTGKDIAFNYENGSVKHRDAVDGVVPVGIVEELIVVGENAELLSVKMKQEEDLYLGGIEWKPIGNSFSNKFTGSYDGNNCKIHDLTINMTDQQYVGLFGITGAGTVLENITVASGNIEGGRYTGAIAARTDFEGLVRNCVNYARINGSKDNTGGIVGQCFSRIEDCSNYGEISGWAQVAGIVGTLQNNMARCSNYGYVHASDENILGSSIAGIVSHAASGNCTIEDCQNEGKIEGKNSIGGICASLGRFTLKNCKNSGKIIVWNDMAGGIAASAGGQCIIQNCENSGIICGEKGENIYTKIGGIAGMLGENGQMESCTNKASAKIELNGDGQYIGGIVGSTRRAKITNCINEVALDYPTSSCVGSIAGKSHESEILYCNNAVAVTAREYAGGIVGINDEGAKIRMCENTGKVTADTFSGGIAGITWGTISASINRNTVSGGQYVGGLCGAVAGQYSYLLASYNTGTVNGNSEVGGVCGIARQQALVEACYSTANVTGESLTGGVCGDLMEEEIAEIKTCFWTGYNGKGCSDGNGDVKYFEDGTSIPDGVEAGWPVESLNAWGINTAGNDGKNGLWWKNLGTKGTSEYPVLWWE